MGGIDVDGMTGRAVAKGDHACAQRGLDSYSALDGNRRQATVRGGGRGEQGEAGAQAAGGAADRRDRAPAGGRADKRRQDASEGQTRRRQACGLGRPERRGEVRSAPLSQGGEEEKATGARGRAAACA